MASPVPHYEVLSPWGEIDPVASHSIAPRVSEIAGSKIGLFANFKTASRPMLSVVEQQWKERFPNAELSWFLSPGQNVIETQTDNKERFEKWVREVDGVVLSAAD